MKLNAAAEMLPLSRPEFMGMHPLVPEDQAEGYRELINNLSEDCLLYTSIGGGEEGIIYSTGFSVYPMVSK